MAHAVCRRDISLGGRHDRHMTAPINFRKASAIAIASTATVGLLVGCSGNSQTNATSTPTSASASAGPTSAYSGHVYELSSGSIAIHGVSPRKVTSGSATATGTAGSVSKLYIVTTDGAAVGAGAAIHLELNPDSDVATGGVITFAGEEKSWNVVPETGKVEIVNSDTDATIKTTTPIQVTREGSSDKVPLTFVLNGKTLLLQPGE